MGVKKKKGRVSNAKKELPKRLDVAERRRLLLEVGKRVFTEHAYDKMSTDKLARLAGVSKGLLYHYFPSKRDYYVATIREVARQVSDATAPIFGASFHETLQRSLTNFVAYIEENDKLYRMLVRGGIGSDREVNEILHQLRQESCDRLIEHLQVNKATPRLLAAVFGWVGFVEFACLHWVEHRQFEREELIELLMKATAPVIEESQGKKR